MINILVKRGLGFICIFLANLLLIECEQHRSVCLPEADTKMEVISNPVRYCRLTSNGSSLERQVYEIANVAKFYNLPDTCRTKCNPKCRNGYCVRNDDNRGTHCVCLKGYKLTSSFRCEAQCNLNCGNYTECTKPYKCNCRKGYKRSEDNFTNCEPNCSMSCEPERFCFKPNTCKCKPGYEETALAFCQPICKLNKCKKHEECVQPEECECAKNYQNNTGTCQPYCKGGCRPYEICSEPGECKCKVGYRKISTGFCEPYCDIANDEHCRNCSSSVHLGTILISSTSVLTFMCVTAIIAFVFTKRYKSGQYNPHTGTDRKVYSIDLGHTNHGAENFHYSSEM